MGTLTSKARALRTNQTEAEKTIWYQIRNRRLLGLKFHRQYPIPPYIVDFICHEKKLIIEIDGGQHSIQADNDEKRTAYLQAKGFTVIRFWNNEVLENIEGVLETIYTITQDPPLPL